jgi:hypothetical protein
MALSSYAVRRVRYCLAVLTVLCWRLNKYYVEVRALEVKHSLKTLLPYRVLLIPNWEKRDRQCCSSGEAVLAQGGESDVCHQLNAGVELTANDEPRPQLRGVEGYHPADLALVHAVGRG